MKLEQLLADPSFENWAARSNEADYAKWENWRMENPAYSDLMDEAKLMINGIGFKKTKVPEYEKQAEWETLAKQLGLENQPVAVYSMRQRRWAIAAAAAICLLAVSWWLFNQPGEPALLTATTGFGELRTLKLPDGSTVTLNANSELLYPQSWEKGQTRRVELRGEAFFEVQPRKEPFIVSAGEVETEVLGTSFNIFARRQTPVVSLLEGSVRISETQTGANALLQPGETAQFDTKENEFNITRGKIAQQTSWKNRRWLFDNTSLSEILQRIEEEYGLTSEVEHKELLNRKVSGQVSTSQLPVLLLALETLLDLQIQRENGVLKIEG